MTNNSNSSALQFSHQNSNLIAGFLAGMASTSLLYPLELVKVRFQSGNLQMFNYTSTFDALKTSFRTEGIVHGWYRGFFPSLFGASIGWAQYFWLYSSFKDYFHNASGCDKLSYWQYLFTSFSAGCIVQASLTPLWVVKVNQQLSSYERGFISGSKSLYKNEGIRGFYRGLVPGLWSSMQGAIQFLFYENLKLYFNNQNSSTISIPQTLFATTIAKSAAVILTSPIEVIKVHMRDIRHASQSNSSMYQAGVSIFKNHGLRGFYRGVSATLIRLMPSQWVTFVTYETMMKWLKAV